MTRCIPLWAVWPQELTIPPRWGRPHASGQEKRKAIKAHLPRGFLDSTTAGKPQWPWWWSPEGGGLAHDVRARALLPPASVLAQLSDGHLWERQMWMLHETCVQFCNDGGSDAGWDGGEVNGEGGHAALLARRWRRPGLPPPRPRAPCWRAGHLHGQVNPPSVACHPPQTAALYSIGIIVPLFQPLPARIQWEHFLRKKMQINPILGRSKLSSLSPSFPFQAPSFFPLPSAPLDKQNIILPEASRFLVHLFALFIAV